MEQATAIAQTGKRRKTMNCCHKLMKLLVVVGFLTVILGFSDKAVAQTWIELAPTGAPPQPVFSPKNIHYDAANNRLIAFYPGNPPFNGILRATGMKFGY